ncbi:hypothetical protein AVEN_84794-1 [Araneus ventricosus]|uniref:Uncharacterized protein n=1 Tax=Araneus ventricosus TaxID=182803 RepID=A0A4Y2S9W0_ARAVE|nr:hypothetical protein AVEN_84794-1 [Araneus ventricosus]
MACRASSHSRFVLVDCGRWNSGQSRRSHSAWLGKPRVTQGSHLCTVVGGIPTSRVVPTAHGFANLESLEVCTYGLWSVEFRPFTPFPRYVACQTSSHSRFVLVGCGRWNSDQSRRSKSLGSAQVNGCTDAVWPLPPLMCELLTAITRETTDTLRSHIDYSCSNGEE